MDRVERDVVDREDVALGVAVAFEREIATGKKDVKFEQWMSQSYLPKSQFPYTSKQLLIKFGLK